MLSLSGTWKLMDFNPGEGEKVGAHLPGFDDSGWMDVDVPGDVHSALIRARRIPHPYDGMNIEKCRWVEDRQWWYRTTFPASALPPGGRYVLRCMGLDTFAQVYVNGVLIGESRNAFDEYEFEFQLDEGTDSVTVAVAFAPATAVIERNDSSPYWAAFYAPRVWARKAQMAYGWDWGPRLATVGIWRDVAITGLRRPRIESVYARTASIASDGAVVLVRVETVQDDGDLALEAELGTEQPRGEAPPVTARRRVVSDETELRLVVPDPKLWWTHDIGEPFLYNLRVRLLDGDRVLDQRDTRIGIRTIELLQEPNAENGTKSFTFCLNGVKLFAKGADWIPADSMIGSIEPERYRRLLEMARDANMNMLRVWGGGIYEQDVFYDTCDELGLLIWQDFMFSCAAYPDHDRQFVSLVESEARTQLERLRNHPCIAIWCGNNENDWIDDMGTVGEPERPFYGWSIYHKILPALCAELDPSRPYWPSSPYGGNDHNDERQGDKHNWQVWAGHVYPRRFGEPQRSELTPEGVSYRHYARDRGRFISEFGIHASPPLETLRRHIPDEELSYDSEQFLYRIKDPDKERKKRMMLAHTGLPRDLEDYERLSMLVQAEGLKFGIEHYRRLKFDCSGTLFWQLNDCWPCISWSVIDYYLNPKAGYHYARRAYAPRLLSFCDAGDRVELWGVNDTLKDAPIRATVVLARLDGTEVGRWSLSGTIPKNGKALLWSVPAVALGIHEDADRYLYVTPQSDGLEPNILFFREFKDLKMPPAQVRFRVQPGEEGENVVTVESDRLAYFVRLKSTVEGARFSDNWFFILPGESRNVTVTAPAPLDASDITVDWLNR